MSAALRGLKAIQGSVAGFVFIKNTEWLSFDVANFASTGTGVLWVDPQKAFSSNNQYTSVTLPIATSESQRLQSTNLQSLSLPAGVIIAGIETRVEGTAAVGDMNDLEVGLLVNGIPAGENRAVVDDTTRWDSEVYNVYGGFNDLWGLDLSVSDVTAADFGFYIRVKGTTTPTTIAVIDHIQMRIYYKL